MHTLSIYRDLAATSITIKITIRLLNIIRETNYCDYKLNIYIYIYSINNRNNSLSYYIK
jgi:hypothetical protein